MKTKNIWLKIVSIIIVVSTIITTAVYAVNNTITETKKTVEKEAETAENKLSEISLEKNIELKSISQTIKTEKQNTDEYYESMAKYAKFIQIYQPTEAEQKYINQLVTEGYKLNKLIEIYKLWIDTDEDIELIKKIYDTYEPTDEEDNHWVEAVYNQITENKYGVLDREQIHAYYDKGLNRDDIITANRLCRMGKNTITEILDKRVTGTSWAELIEENYTKSTKNKMQKQSMRQSKSPQKEQYKQIQNGTEILDAYFLAKRTEKDINEYLDKLSSGETIDQEMNQYYSERTEGLLEKLKEQGLWDEPQEIKEKNKKAKEYLKKKAIENGMTQEKINKLIDQGHTELEILNASTVTKKQKVDVQKVLEQKRAGQTWEDLLQKEVQ